MNKNVFWHVVLISFRRVASSEVREKVFALYQTLATDCGGISAGILYWKVAHNLDMRKEVHLVEIAVFRDGEAFQAFRRHPKHQELTGILEDVADWQVGDVVGEAFSPRDLDTAV